ncbi:MAG: TonB-dependent receptor [Pyrinomonadaceae bacterium]|nr:TonB-dependent receptor [Pyrinomonadaceae bacterium]
MGNLLSRAVAFVAVMLSLSVLAAAQGTTSRMTGTVTDSSGAAVAGATVTLTNEGTNTSFTATTNSSGVYVFDLIQPGTYTVTVEREGFKKFISSKNPVLINQPATVNVALEVGDVSAVVSVEASAEQVQTSTSGNVGSTVEQKTLESLPIVGLRGRNPLDLLNYQPGVVVGSNTGGGVHVNGSRDRAFNFTLDGIDINESTAGGSNFTPLRPNPDSLQEFQLVTSNATAELGRSSGAQVTLVTKSGTNRYSGNLFEYYQTPRFIANEFENNLLGIGRRQFVQHIYGGSFGGPIPNFGFGEGTEFFKPLRDRAFFFVNLQKLSAVETRLAQRTVYTESALNGTFRYIAGQRNAPAGTSTASVNPDGSPRYPACSASVTTLCVATFNLNTMPITQDPFIVNMVRAYPRPNDYSRGDGLNFAGYNFNAGQTEKQWDLVTRFDIKINDNNNFYARYAQGEQNTIGDSVNGGLPPFPGYPNLVNTYRTPKNLALNYRWSPTARFTNEFIFGYSTFGFSFATEEPRADVPFILNTVTDAFTNFAYNAREARTFQFVDNVTFDLSPHTIKAGLNFRFGRQFDDRSSAGGVIEGSVGFGAGSSDFTGFGLPASGGATGINSSDLTNLRSTINNWIGRIGSYSQGFVVSPSNPNAWAPGGTRWNWTAYYPEYDFYVQDTWRYSQNLTFDIGLRWEYKPAPSSKDLPILVPDQPFTTGSAPSNTLRWVEGDLFEDDWNNFSPSIGFAWDPFKTGKTSVRANYRLAYDRFPSQVFANSVYQSAPGNTSSASAVGIAQQNLLLRNGLPDLTPTRTPDELRQPAPFSTSGITVVDPDTRYPESHQWFAGIQREIGWNSVLEVNYIGRKGTHLFGGYDANQVNIFASDPRCSQNFLQAFNAVRGGSTDECLINLLFTGNPTNAAGTATFRSIPAIQTTLSMTNTGGSVANAAAVVSQRTSGSSQMIATTIGNPFFFQKYPQFSGSLNVLDSNDYSFYNGLEVILKRRFTGGFSYQVGYTYSKSKDTRSFDPTFTTVSRANNQSASSTPFNINDRDLNYAWSDFDRRHVLQATYVFEVPFGKGRKWGSDIPTALDWVIGGWQVSGTYNWASGRPFTVYSGLNTFSNVNQSFANCDGCTRDMGGLVERNGTWYWFSQDQEAMFSQPAPGELGNTGRNFFIGPRQFQTDISLLKKFRFTETLNLDFRVDARNLTNTPSFGLPTATYNSSVFGRIRDSVTSFARRIQFSAKLNF